MKISWAKPSLSRDFVLLSAAILFVLLLISGWVTYSTYVNHAQRIVVDLEKEATRIDHSLSDELENANYMLSSLGRQIVLEPNRDYTRLAQSLKAFDSKGNIYSIFSWTSPEGKMVVSSNRGVLEEPVDISDRDFIQQSSVDSWKMHIGRPIEGRVSQRWVIPAGMGITDYTGKFIGVVSLSLDIGTLTQQVSNLVKRDGISFAIVNKALIPLTEVSEQNDISSGSLSTHKLADIDFAKNPSGLFGEGNLILGTGNYLYYKMSEHYPYVVVVGYDTHYSDEAVRMMLWARLLQVFMVAIFFVLFLWMVRARVISPVLAMTAAMAAVARGDKYTNLPKNTSVEIEAMAAQVRQIEQYIDETKRVEDELRNKIFLLKKSKELSDVLLRSKSEFLAYLSQEIRLPLNNIIGFSQTLKDQMYGPLENKKYRQYAADIFTISNQLMAKMQDVLAHSKLETGYIPLQEKSLVVAEVVNAALRQIADKLQAGKNTVKVNVHDNLPRLMADEFRLQQIISNLLLAIIDNIAPDSVILLEAKIISEHRDKKFFVLTINKADDEQYSQEKLLQLAEQLFALSAHGDIMNGQFNIGQDEAVDLRVELARLLVAKHGGVFYSEGSGKIQRFTILFPANRLVFEELA